MTLGSSSGRRCPDCPGARSIREGVLEGMPPREDLDGDQTAGGVWGRLVYIGSQCWPHGQRIGTSKDFTPLRGAWGLERRGSRGGGQGAWSLVMSQGGGQEFTCCCGLDQGAKGAMRG